MVNIHVHTWTTIFNNSRANKFCVTRQISLIMKLIRDLMPINTLCNFDPDWLRNVVSIALTRFKTAIFNNSWANNFCATGRISLIIETHPRSCAYKYFVQLWSRLIEKCGLYCANKVKNSNLQYFRCNNSGVTGRILLTIELIRDLVPINTLWVQVWSRLIKKCGLYPANKKRVNVCTDTRTMEELPRHKPLWPLASGANKRPKFQPHWATQKVYWDYNFYIFFSTIFGIF